jgi:serine kinase of HPr protein (carbohydrate metabolism regulator)
MSAMTAITVHASCVCVGQHGVLLLGAPGAGKSDLALRLIDQPGLGAGDAPLYGKLVADDQVTVTRLGNRLFATPHQRLAGLLEVRGSGIHKMPYLTSCELSLAVQLGPNAEMERMPASRELQHELLGICLPLIYVDASQASAAGRVRVRLTSIPMNQQDG